MISSRKNQSPYCFLQFIILCVGMFFTGQVYAAASHVEAATPYVFPDAEKYKALFPTRIVDPRYKAPPAAVFGALKAELEKVMPSALAVDTADGREALTKRNKLKEAYYRIINCYQEAGAPFPNTGFFSVPRKDDLIGALKDVSRAFQGTKPDAEVPELFFFLYMHAQITGERYRNAVWRENHAPDAQAFDEYLKLLLFHSVMDKDPSASVPTGEDYRLPANIQTFTVAQLYLARLLTEPVCRDQLVCAPPMDWIVKDLIPAPLVGETYTAYNANHMTLISKKLAEGSTYYRGVISPKALARNLFPDYVVLPIAAALDPKNLVLDLPDGIHNLWMARTPVCPHEDSWFTSVAVRGGRAPAIHGWILELDRLFIFMARTHQIISLSNLQFIDAVKLWEKPVFNLEGLNKKRRVYYEAMGNVVKWCTETGLSEDEKAVRLFISFLFLEENPNALRIGFILEGKGAVKEITGIDIKLLRNQFYHRSFLPISMQGVLCGEVDAPIMVAEALIIDQLKDKYKELCMHLAKHMAGTKIGFLDFLISFSVNKAYGAGQGLPTLQMDGVDGTIYPHTAQAYVASVFVNSALKPVHWVVLDKGDASEESKWEAIEKYVPRYKTLFPTADVDPRYAAPPAKVFDDLRAVVDTAVTTEALKGPYRDIITCYQEAGAPSRGSGLFPVPRKDDLIGALKKVSMAFKYHKPGTGVSELFFLLYMHAQITGERYRSAVWREHHKPDAMYFDAYLDLLWFYVTGDKSRATAEMQNRADYKLPANIQTFMAGQWYLAWLLTEPLMRSKSTFGPEFTWPLENLIPQFFLDSEKYRLQGATHLTRIINHLQGGSPYYRDVLSPLAVAMNLFPDYVPLPVAATLGARHLVEDLPDGTHNLWMAGLPVCPYGDRDYTGSWADNNDCTALEFWVHDLFHLTVCMQNTHLVHAVAREKFSDVVTLYTNARAMLDTHMTYLGGKREMYYEAVRNATQWFMEEGISKDEKALRLFVAFYGLHETRLPLNIVNILARHGDSAAIRLQDVNLSMSTLRNKRYYRSLLPGPMQEVLGKDLAATALPAETAVMDQIHKKYREFCTYLADHTKISSALTFNTCDRVMFFPDNVYGADSVSRATVRIGEKDATVLINMNGSLSGYVGSAFVNSSGEVMHWALFDKGGAPAEETWAQVEKAAAAKAREDEVLAKARADLEATLKLLDSSKLAVSPDTKPATSTAPMVAKPVVAAQPYRHAFTTAIMMDLTADALRALR